jgi:hypothetical protein
MFLRESRRTKTSPSRNWSSEVNTDADVPEAGEDVTAVERSRASLPAFKHLGGIALRGKCGGGHAGQFKANLETLYFSLPYKRIHARPPLESAGTRAGLVILHWDCRYAEEFRNYTFHAESHGVRGAGQRGGGGAGSRPAHIRSDRDLDAAGLRLAFLVVSMSLAAQKEVGDSYCSTATKTSFFSMNKSSVYYIPAGWAGRLNWRGKINVAVAGISTARSHSRPALDSTIILYNYGSN